eukprot:s764_g5.t1
MELVAGFAALNCGRAAGRSALPAELYRADPLLAAGIFAPVAMKIAARGVYPLQWSGGVAFSIPKGLKSPHEVTSWRSILLLESEAKAFQKSWRARLIAVLGACRPLGLHGGLPGHTLAQPAALVRSHLCHLKAGGRCGGAIFLDSSAAYYAVVRDLYFAGSGHGLSDQQLRERAAFLFVKQADREYFFAEMRQGRWLESLQIPAPLLRVVRAQLGHTWSLDGQPGTQLYRTHTGTAPGSPVADVLFAVLFSRYLHDVETFLQSLGCAPTVSLAWAGPADSAPTPTWADDVVILFQVEHPQGVRQVVEQVGSFAVGQLSSSGLAANLGQGKTEAVLAIRGCGSRQVRRDLLAAHSPSVDLAASAATARPLRIVQNYVHLGAVVNAEISEVPNLKHRQGLLWAAFRPLKFKVLSNPWLSLPEKRGIVLGRLVPRFMFGSGLWRLGNQAERQAALSPLCSLFRQCIRPFLGCSSERMHMSEVLSALGLPSPEELLHVERVRAFLDILKPDMRATWLGFVQDGVWLATALESLCVVLPAASSWPGFARLPTELDLGVLAGFVEPLRPALKRACKAYLKRAVASRPAVSWETVRARQSGEPDLTVVSTAATALPFVCGKCGQRFLNRRRLAVHSARRHQQHALSRCVAVGTRCERCQLEFWSEDRLAAHLARSAQRLATYSEADFARLPPPLSKDTGWKPATATYGPRPWWATLSPEVSSAVF